MAELKTQKNDGDVDVFLASIENEGRRGDAIRLRRLMEEVTGEPACMWGASIVGFGSYRYRYASGTEGEWFLVGFSPRKQNLTLYIMSGFDGYDSFLADLGKHSTGKSCLYLKRLADVDQDVLRQLVISSVDHVRASRSEN